LWLPPKKTNNDFINQIESATPTLDELQIFQGIDASDDAGRLPHHFSFLKKNKPSLLVLRLFFFFF